MGAKSKTNFCTKVFWASLVDQLLKNPPAIRRCGFDPWAGKIPWRRERLPPPVFWPGEFHGPYSPWGHKESDTTEQLSRKEGLLPKLVPEQRDQLVLICQGLPRF